MIARQLRERGQRLCLLPPEDAFSGRFGAIYLGGIYHHGKGVFAGVDDPLLQRQIGWEHRWYRARVLEDGRYDLTWPRRSSSRPCGRRAASPARRAGPSRARGG